MLVCANINILSRGMLKTVFFRVFGITKEDIEVSDYVQHFRNYQTWTSNPPMQAWYLHAPIAIFGYLNLWNKASLRVLYVQGTNQDTVLLSHVTADDFPDTKKKQK